MNRYLRKKMSVALGGGIVWVLFIAPGASIRWAFFRGRKSWIELSKDSLISGLVTWAILSLAIIVASFFPDSGITL
jgi:hypothetical protein